jgi:DnaJ family protein C protein 11
LLFHPDRQSSSQDTELSAQKFQIIQRAYDVLSNPKLRSEYDESRQNMKSKNWTVSRKGMEAEEVILHYAKL